MPLQAIENMDSETKAKEDGGDGQKVKKQASISDMFAKQTKKRKIEESQEGYQKKPKIEWCKTCKQQIVEESDVWYTGHPDGAEDEFMALFKPNLIIESDNHEERPMIYLDHFTVYDKQGHMVPLNTGLLESGSEILFSGRLKSLLRYKVEEGYPVMDCYMLSWWYSGFDGGDVCNIGFSTETADYHVLEPTPAYARYMRNIWEQGFLVKFLIEYLSRETENDEDSGEEEEQEEGVYERFLNYLSQQKPQRKEVNGFTSETVLEHAEFLVSQLVSYQDTADKDEKNLLESNLVKIICEMAGIQKERILKAKTEVLKRKVKKEEKKFVEATVTNLVRNVFEDIMAEQMAADDLAAGSGQIRTKACGLCEACQAPDCGECSHCKDMIKYGGSGKMKQRCKQRKCVNKDIKDDIGDVKTTVKKDKDQARQVTVKTNEIEFSWPSEPVKTVGKKKYYDCVKLDGEEVRPGDNILIQPDLDQVDNYVGTVVYMYDTEKNNPQVHVKWFARGVDTVLGEAGDKPELFALDSCDTVPLLSYSGKAEVEMRKVPDQSTWRAQGGAPVKEWKRESESHFYCSLKYETKHGRFEYPCQEEQQDVLPGECMTCQLVEEESMRLVARTKTKNESGEITCVTWDRDDLRIGDTVYLTRASVKIKSKPSKFTKENTVTKKFDERLYPEMYRKGDYVKGNNFKTPEPFVVARILKFKEGSDGVRMKVGVFYRPENLYASCKEEESSMFQLYWSQDTDTVEADNIQGRCYVRSCTQEKEDDLRLWCEEGPDRWYFTSEYDSTSKKIKELDEEASKFGCDLEKEGEGETNIPHHPKIDRKLACMDIFAGCGGLSQGLHDSGVADTRWAVEIYEPAARAFAQNNQSSTVFSDDCNLLLRNVMQGKTHNEKKQKYPKKGEVELLCGGPPCQGFSGMNRFNAGEYSKFKNSLVATYLSYAEFYRPRFFILENVKNFACFKKSMVMKCCLKALVKMGYQCAFGILQAGNFGVAQTRRRAILLAAAPGEKLPLYPDPEHVFSPQACHLSVEVDGVRFETQSRWRGGAPRRTVTVWDTMSDLPKIQQGETRDVQEYKGKARSHFQQKIRAGSKKLYDHVTKNMAPLIVARFERIPTTPGSDWRDLPNEIVELSDKSKTRKLVYLYNDNKNGKSSNGEKRGVCPCAEGKKCDPKDKQQFTLIPWCLPHTGNRHNHWAGLYGRVEWDGFFSTTVTNPEPMGKQGRVLHPDQNRLVTVRECARSQGFPDVYKFYGTVLEKHRQIGNAVPPPMGRALGQSIGAAMVQGPK